jgi:O-succinylbenzoate synthase
LPYFRSDELPNIGLVASRSRSRHGRKVQPYFGAAAGAGQSCAEKILPAQLNVEYRLAFRRYRLPFLAPVRTAHGRWEEREGVIVRVENERGTVGFGEAAPVPGFGAETAAHDAAALRELGEKVDKPRLASVPITLPCLQHALAAAQRAIVSVASDLNSAERPPPEKNRDYLPICALLPAGRGALKQLAVQAEAGFRVFKWKVGVGDAADELGLLDDLCGALPGGAKLRLDANGAWDRRRAERWLERCADRPIDFVEQPIAPETRGSTDLLLGLANDYPTPLALDESVAAESDIERWLGLGWPGVFVLKLSLVADVDRALARLAKAKAAVVFSSALETAVGAQTALRAAFAWGGEPRALGFGVWPLFENSPCNGPSSAPFIRWEDVERINPEAVWNALS